MLKLSPRDFHLQSLLEHSQKGCSLQHSELLALFCASHPLPFSPSTLATSAVGSASSLADSASFAQASAAVGDQVPQLSRFQSEQKVLAVVEKRHPLEPENQVQRGQSPLPLLRGRVWQSPGLPWLVTPTGVSHTLRYHVKTQQQRAEPSFYSRLEPKSFAGGVFSETLETLRKNTALPRVLHRHQTNSNVSGSSRDLPNYT